MHSNSVSPANSIDVDELNRAGRPLDPAEQSAKRCLTEMSGATLVVGALGGSALLWIAVLAVI